MGKIDSKDLDALESRIRSTIEVHRKFLEGLTVDPLASQERFISRVGEAVAEADFVRSIPSFDFSERSFVTLASIDIEWSAIDAILKAQARNEAFAPFWKIVSDNAATDGLEDVSFCQGFVKETHVTMAHYLQVPQREIHATFGPLSGRHVSVTVQELLWSDRVAALQVKVGNETIDDHSPTLSVPPPKNDFPHVTIWFHKNASAKEANDLPKLVKTGHAKAIKLSESDTLTGIISLWKRK